MDSNMENAMIIIKAMVESSRVWASTGDAIRRITNLKSNEINEAVPYLEAMNLVTTLPGRSKVRYDFFNVSLAPQGYEYYNQNFGKIKKIE
ncbi:MAG TPA: hypothetical protein VK426_09155 [Methanobacterium sp.]|nr:hypothetical protein [Methanobacterium sp.]